MSQATQLCNVPVESKLLHSGGGLPIYLECTRRALHRGDHEAWMIGECLGQKVRIEVSWAEAKES